jgi:hypothetical protein
MKPERVRKGTLEAKGYQESAGAGRRISTKLGDETFEKVKKYALEEGETMSAAIRHLVLMGLMEVRGEYEED